MKTTAPSLMNPVELASLFFGVACIAGWLAAGTSAPDSGNPSSGVTGRNATQAHSKLQNQPSDAARRAMAGIRNEKSAAARMKSTTVLVDSLSAGEIRTWLDEGWFSLRDGFDTELFINLAKARWEELDPDGYLLWSAGQGSQDAGPLLASIAASDPERALKICSEYGKGRTLTSWLMAIGKVRPEEVLNHFGNFRSGLEAMDNYDRDSLFFLLARSHPDDLVEACAAFSPALKYEADLAGTEQRLLNSFDQEISRLQSDPKGGETLYSAMMMHNEIAQNILTDPGKIPPEWMTLIVQYLPVKTLDQVERLLAMKAGDQGYSEELIGKIHFRALEALRTLDPAETLRRMKDYDSAEQTRSSLLQSVFSQFQHEPERGEPFLASLDSEEDRNIARSALHSSPAPKPDEASDPHSLIQALATTPADYKAASAISQAAQTWSDEDMAAVRSEFRSLPEDQKLNAATSIAMSHALSREPELKGEALSYLATVSADNLETAPFSGQGRLSHTLCDFAVEWVEKDAGAASAWATTLPEGKTRNSVIRNMAFMWSQYDPEAAKNWQQSLAAAPR